MHGTAKFALCQFCLLIFFCYSSIVNVSGNLALEPMSEDERLALKEEAREMFYHAYNAYMVNAYPADELMPLSCGGRYRDVFSSRGDIDDVLGNFSLTLVDTLDTLVILGDLFEFERAVKLIIRDVSFDTDVTVSVFETNIRMVGGLISGHVLSLHIKQLYGMMSWYKGELLALAQDVATRLLPAFNTTTGLPYPRVNLRYGMKSLYSYSRDTCTSCAGTMILEFAALSRLTGESVFEEKARHTLDYLWQQRHRSSNLVGTILNVHSGDWVRRDSGVGAGIDSYYEYLLKAHVLLGDDDYLHRFNKHYDAVMKYVSQGPMLLDVHMHRPHSTSRNYMDAFLAFWPGLQVLKGDIKPAIETHEMLYQVTQRHNFLPEAFTTDFQVHWGQHPLRPEFVESTFLLYEATEDPYYLGVGREILKALQKHAWVPCGYASLKDVRTGRHEDRLDSFVLSETFKYLYLLFSKPNELPINLNEFIFTTEAHLLPLSISGMRNVTVKSGGGTRFLPKETTLWHDEFYSTCPNAYSAFPGQHQYAESIRKPLKNYVESACSSGRLTFRGTVTPFNRKLRAVDFQASNGVHIDLLRSMGITVQMLSDGRVHLLHSSSQASSPEDAEEGLLFMQEMIDLSKVQQDQPDNPPKAVIFTVPSLTSGEEVPETIVVRTLMAGPAQFGKQLKQHDMVEGHLVIAEPYRACESLNNADAVQGAIVLMERGDCLFIEKARVIQKLGAVGGIVVDNSASISATTPLEEDSSSASSKLDKEEELPPLFAMSGDNSPDDVTIPLVFLFAAPAKELLTAYREARGNLTVLLADYPNADKTEPKTNRDIVLPAEKKQKECSLIESILKAKTKAKSEEKAEFTDQFCNDDLVTVVHDARQGEIDPNVPSSASCENNFLGEDEVISSKTADELSENLIAFVNKNRNSHLNKGRRLFDRVQKLLIRVGQGNPQLLRAMLSSNVATLMRIMEDSFLDPSLEGKTLTGYQDGEQFSELVTAAAANEKSGKDEDVKDIAAGESVSDNSDVSMSNGITEALPEKLSSVWRFDRPKLIDEAIMSLLGVLIADSVQNDLTDQLLDISDIANPGDIIKKFEGSLNELVKQSLLGPFKEKTSISDQIVKDVPIIPKTSHVDHIQAPTVVKTLEPQYVEQINRELSEISPGSATLPIVTEDREVLSKDSADSKQSHTNLDKLLDSSTLEKILSRDEKSSQTSREEL